MRTESTNIINFEQFKPTDPIAPYLGGKRLLAKTIVPIIEKIPHNIYAEPFMGMGGVFFRRTKKPKCEAINDINSEIVNMFRMVERFPNYLADMLKFKICSRAEFKRMLATPPLLLTELERAVRYLYIQKNAFGGKVRGQAFGVSVERAGRFNVERLIPQIQELHRRLTGVYCECLPYQEFITRYDRPDTLFYLDPPYWNCENDYGKGIFGKADFDELAKLLKEIKARITRLYRWSKAETEKPQTQQSSLAALWEAQQQLNAPRTRTGKIRALQESAALFSFLQANGIQSMQQLHEKIADMNSRYYDLRGKIVKAERQIATLTERGEMWEQYNQYKSIHKQLAKVKPEKREQFEQRHSRELILYDAAARYLKELKDSGEGITPKAWQREIDQLTAGKQTDTLAMKSMREDLKAVERLRKTAEQLSRQERDKSHDRGPER